MIAIERNPKNCEKTSYDLIIVGGGIYGASLALESVRRGLKPLLLEKDEFGHATSSKSLRIIHGGLRYLQALDFGRHQESVRERSWFLRNFPDLVEPMECLMPIYERGIRRTSVLKTAMIINDLLSHNRNRGLREDHYLKNGEIIGPSQTVARFHDVDQNDLSGSVIWHDAAMTDSRKLLLEFLKWGTHYGADALNRMQARQLILEENRVTGLIAADSKTNEFHSFQSPVVVNCAGPWTREVARKMHRDIPQLFSPTLGFNVILNKKLTSKMTVAVTPNYSGGQTYFLRPYEGQIFAGTSYAPWRRGLEEPKPSEENLKDFITDLNLAVPNWSLKLSDIKEIYSGLLPASKEMTTNLSAHETLIKHEKLGGPSGLYSVSGVKFTTARLVAEKTLRMIYKNSGKAYSYIEGTDRPTNGKL